MITDKNVRKIAEAVVRDYCALSPRKDVAGFDEVEKLCAAWVYCWGYIESGEAFVVHRSPRNGSIAFSFGDSLGEVLLSLVVESNDLGVNLAFVLFPDAERN